MIRITLMIVGMIALAALTYYRWPSESSRIRPTATVTATAGVMGQQ